MPTVDNKQPLAETMTLRQLVTIAATTILILIAGLTTLTGTWSGMQTMRIASLESWQKEFGVTMERLKTEKEQLRKSFDEDHAQLRQLVDFAVRADENIKTMTETMRLFKTAMDAVAAQQIGLRSSLEDIRMEIQRGRPSVMHGR